MRLRIAIVVGMVLVVSPRAAHAQSSGMIVGEAGVTFGSETGGAFGVTVGSGSPRIQGIGEVGYFTNVTPKSLQEDADVIALLASSPGALVGVDITAPAFYALGGIRAVVPTTGRAKPYVQGGAGVARVKATLDFTLNGTNVNSLLIAEGVLTRDDLEQSSTEALISFGGGVQVAVGGRGLVDVGYRYYRIFTDDPGINVNRIFGGFGVTF
jgi:opacity protein-like surface antigen